MRRVLATTILAIVLVAGAGNASSEATTGFVPVPGGKLFYEVQGHGPEVILIHGGMLDHRMWDAQVAALAAHFRVIRYDVACHGQSPTPDGDWKSYEHLWLLMRALEVDRASLVGLSLGGRIAIDFAIAYPEQVRSLVLVDPGMSGFPFTGRDFAASMTAGLGARRAGDPAKAAELFLRSWLAGPHRTPDQVDPAIWARALEMAIPNALRLSEGSELEPPAVSRLDEIQAPVLVIEGQLDCEDIHHIGRLIEHRVPGTRRVVIPGVAHMPNLERPDEVNRLLLGFLLHPPVATEHTPGSASKVAMIPVPGGELWAECRGDGDVVVLIHDGVVHSAGWDDVLPLLASQYRVVRYDRRGYGRSSTPSAPFSDLEDLAAVVRQFDATRVHLVGSSSGGRLAIDFAIAHPEQVASLTLVGAVVSGFPSTRHMRTRGGRLVAGLSTDLVRAREYWISIDPYFLAPNSAAARARVAALLEQFPHDLDVSRGRFATTSPPALPRLGSVHVPTLVLTGEHDIPDVHAHSGAITAGIPHARRDVLSDCGHAPYIEQPFPFARTVLEFLQDAPFAAILDEQGPAAALAALRAARGADPAMVPMAENELNSRGYRLLAASALDDAIVVFRLNVVAFPASPNAHDSLGEALLAAGDRAGAIASYRRALELDPDSASARAALQQLMALPE